MSSYDDDEMDFGDDDDGVSLKECVFMAFQRLAPAKPRNCAKKRFFFTSSPIASSTLVLLYL